MRLQNEHLVQSFDCKETDIANKYFTVVFKLSCLTGFYAGKEIDRISHFAVTPRLLKDKLNVIMSDSIIRCTIKYLQDIWNIRTELFYENV